MINLTTQNHNKQIQNKGKLDTTDSGITPQKESVNLSNSDISGHKNMAKSQGVIRSASSDSLRLSNIKSNIQKGQSEEKKIACNSENKELALNLKNIGLNLKDRQFDPEKDIFAKIIRSPKNDE